MCSKLSGIRKAISKGIRHVLSQKGFTQIESIDYNETFFPIFMKDFFRTILVLVTHFDLELHQMDVKTTFLSDDIEEAIYMVQPDIFEAKGSQHLVCKLKKFLWSKTSIPTVVFEI